MADYRFSVGKIVVGSTTIALCTGISVKLDGGPAELRAGDYRYPVAINHGAKSLEITVESAKFDVIPSEFDDAYVTVELQAGTEGGGVTETITNMKIVSYDLKTEQDAFVTSTLVLRKAENPS